MARIRTIKPEFPQSESMGRVSRDARLLFVMLWTLCDDEGRCRAAPRLLANLLFPYDLDAAENIPGWMTELQCEGCVSVYTHEGNTYLQIVKWAHHQRVDKPSKSKFPSISEGAENIPGSVEKVSLGPGPKEGTRKGEEQKVPLPNGNGRSAPPELPVSKSPELAADPWKPVYDFGKEVLGTKAGGVISALKAALKGKPDAVMAKLEEAASKSSPIEWITALLRTTGDLGGRSGGVTWEDCEALALTFMRPFDARQVMAGLRATFPDRPAAAKGKLGEVAKLPGEHGLFAINTFLWEHGAPGISVGSMS